MTPEQVRHIAHLARLELTDEEVERTSREFVRILAELERLDGVSADHVEPLHQPLPLADVLRADEPADGLGHDAALGGAPAPEDGLFRVPPTATDPPA